MVINSDGSIINIKDKLSSGINKKRAEKVTDSKQQGDKVVSNTEKELKKFADIIEIKRENLLAAKSYESIKNEEGAREVLEKIKVKFKEENYDSIISAQNRVDPDKVLKFYPFE